MFYNLGRILISFTFFRNNISKRLFSESVKNIKFKNEKHCEYVTLWHDLLNLITYYIK